MRRIDREADRQKDRDIDVDRQPNRRADEQTVKKCQNHFVKIIMKTTYGESLCQKKS